MCCFVSLLVSNHLDGEEKADCFTFFYLSCVLVNAVWLFLMVSGGLACSSLLWYFLVIVNISHDVAHMVFTY